MNQLDNPAWSKVKSTNDFDAGGTLGRFFTFIFPVDKGLFFVYITTSKGLRDISRGCSPMVEH